MQYKFVAQIAADAEALSELQSTGIDEVEGDQRLLGRKLMEKSFFLRAPRRLVRAHGSRLRGGARPAPGQDSLPPR